MALDIPALGQAIDTTFGRSSTPKTASYSVKFTLHGTTMLVAKYAAIVNFASEKQMIEMKRAYDKESDSVIDASVARVKEIYKDLSGSSVSLKQQDSDESVEIIGCGIHNLKRTAYYRKNVTFEIA